MWKLLAQSVAGSSHERFGQPCQDACAVASEVISDQPIIILTCADGAGSARHADVGAAQACETILNRALADMRDGLKTEAIESDTVLYWMDEVRKQVVYEAAQRQAAPRDFACTLLLTVVGEHSSAFAQIGDGAMVTKYGDEYRPVFWPQAGEYANCTHFLTQDDFADHLEFVRFDERIDELAVFSDGLQRLALNMAKRLGHRPFFEPLFTRLRTASHGDDLREPLRQFLESQRVAQRSDDDKTLILATRVASRAEPTNPL
jgi:hypothetical protein